MFSLRPKSADDCDKFLKRAVTNTQELLEPGTAHTTIWKAIALLNDYGWADDFIRPMYEKNMVVQIGFNTLIPKFINMLTEKKNTDTIWNSLSENEFRKLEKEYAKNMKELREAVRVNEERAKKEKMEESFVKMRQVCRLLCEDPTVVDGLRVVFFIDSISRTVFNVLMPRLTNGLRSDCRIEPSTDVVFF
jgi:hypothetical protein